MPSRTGTHFKHVGVALTGLQACICLFPSPQIKCCFSWLALPQTLCVCVCVCLVVRVRGSEQFFHEWVEVALGTSLPPCLITVTISSAFFCTVNLSDHYIFAQAGYKMFSLRGIWGCKSGDFHWLKVHHADFLNAFIRKLIYIYISWRKVMIFTSV